MAIELRNIDPVIFLHNVGIGTTSPNTRLHVTTSGGNQMVLEDSAAGLNLKKWILNSEAGTLGVKLVNDAFSSSQTFVTVLSSGNVGIGTSSPQSLLYLSGSTPILTIDNNSASQTGSIVFKSLSGTTLAILSSNASTGEVRFGGATTNFFPTFYSNGSEAMRITATGNVGIGTSTPLSKTEVYNSAVLSAFVPATSSTWRVLQVKNYQRTNVGSAAGISFAGDNSNGDTATAGIVGIHNNTTGGDTDLAFLTAIGNVSYERLRINASGNVGIGTTGPEYGLHLGSNAVPKNLAFTIDNSTQAGIIWKYIGQAKINAQISSVGTGSYANKGLAFYTTDTLDTTTNAVERMRITESGNVGIGTTGPTGNLHIQGSNASLKIGNDVNDAGTVGVYFLHTSVPASYNKSAILTTAIGSGGRANMYFALNDVNDSSNVTTANARLTILNGGNVGIGTAAPSEKLHVEGHIKLTGSLKFSDGSSFPNAGTTFPRTMACPIDGARGVYDNDVLWMCDFLYANTNTSFKQMGTNGSHTGGTAYTLASILTTVGAASVGGGHQTATWGDSFMLQISNTTKTYGVPTAYIVVALPCDKNFHNVLHVKTVSHDRWESINGWICNSGGTIQRRLQAHTNAGNGSGGAGFTSCPGPRNQIGKISCCHEWQSIIIPKDYLELYAYSNGASPTGFSVKIALNAGVNNSYNEFWIAGLGISRNPTGFTHINSIDMHWATNGGNTVHWYGSWEYSSMNTLHGRTNYEDIRVPIAGIDKDLLVGFLAHGANWRVAGPICWVQGNQDTTYGNATYYLSKAVIGTFGMVEGNQTNHSLPMGFIVPKEIVASYYNNTNGLRTLPLRIFNTQNDHPFHVRAMYTEQVNRIGNDKTIPGNAFNMKNNNYSTSSLVNLSTYDGG